MTAVSSAEENEKCANNFEGETSRVAFIWMKKEMKEWH
jgi:hypothetical protein